MSLEQLDNNLTTLRHVDSSWGLPPMPEQVMLDLAMLPGATPEMLSTTLYGISDEFETAQAPIPMELDTSQIDEPQYDIESGTYGDESLGRKTARYYGALQGGQRPYELIDEPLKEWKRRAIQGGYIEMDNEEFESPLWRPEYNSIDANMRSDQMESDFRGAAEGSMSVGQLTNWMDDWLSPSGLTRAATELDLAWDYGKIVEEKEEWGDKWRDYSKQPWNPLKLLDAITGPIDEAVVPAINWFLMLTGVGETYLGIKGLMLGAEAAQATKGIKYYDALRNKKFIGPTARAFIPAQRFEGVGAATRLAGFSKPSGVSGWAANALGKQSKWGAGQKFGQWSGGKMQLWRDRKWVQAGKLANQQIYKTGLAGKGLAKATGEGEYDEDGGGWSLEDVGIIEEFRDNYLFPTSVKNIAGDFLWDIAFTPYKIFEPGTIRAIGRAPKVFKNRAYGAASHLIPPLRERLAKAPHRHSRAVASFHEAVGGYLSRTDPDAHKKFEATTAKQSPGAALAEWYNGDEASFGGAFEHALYSIGIEHAAKQAARRIAGISDNFERNNVYLAVKHQLEAQSRYLDPHDIHGNLAEIAAAANPRVAGTVAKGVKRRDLVNKELAKLVEEFLEPAAVAKARGEEVGEGFIRLVRRQDPQSMDYNTWRKVEAGEQLPDSAQVIDLDLEEYAAFLERPFDEIPEIAKAFEGLTGQTLHPAFESNVGRVHRWKDIKAGTARRWDRDKAKWMWDTEIIAEDGVTKMKGVVQNHNDKRVANIAEIINNLETGAPDLTPGLQSQIPLMEGVGTVTPRTVGYMPTLPSLTDALTDNFIERFHHWDEYLAMNEELQEAITRGDLLEGKYLSAKSPNNRRLNLFPRLSDEDRMRPYATDFFMEGAGKVKYIEWVNQGIFAPLLRKIDPGMGRFHLARLGTRTKQEALEFASQVRGRYQLLNLVRTIKGKGLAKDVEQAVDALMSTQTGDLTNKVIRDYLKQVLATEKAAGQRNLAKVFGNQKTQGKFANIVRAIEGMEEQGVSFQKLEDSLVSELTEMANAPQWVDRFGLKPFDAGTDMVEVANKKAKHLMKEANWMAAEVDPADIPTSLVESLHSQGYKIVHGVEFTDPRKLGNLNSELNLHTAHINSRLTLGLSRQNPYWLSNLRMRTTKANLAGRLAYNNSQIAPYAARSADGKIAASGIRPERTSGDPNAPSIVHIIDDLWEIVRDINSENQRALDAVELGMSGGVSKFSTRLRASRTPYSVPDLASLPYKEMKEKIMGMGVGYTEDEFHAIWDALKASRKLEGGQWVRGLAHLEDHLRSRSNLRDILMVLGKHRAGGFMNPEAAKSPTKGLHPLRDLKQLATDAEYASGFARTYGGRAGTWGGTFAAGGGALAVAAQDDEPGEGLGWGMNPKNMMYSLPAALMGNVGSKLLLRRVLGLTPEASRFANMGKINPQALRETGGIATPGSVIGAGLGAGVGFSEGGWESGLVGGVAGGIAGAGLSTRGPLAGGMAGAGLGAAYGGSQGGWEGALAGGVAGGVGGAGLNKAFGSNPNRLWESLPFRNPEAVFSHTDWQRYSHMGDFYVNMRDYLRFSLSPIFDLSRYAEAMTLSQVVGADVAGGMKLNQSPKSFRKLMAREFEAQGFDKANAVDKANDEWTKVRSAFMDQASGRGDFDWENIENMSRWFTSVGIMGFSPQSWMASTFGQMLRAGVNPDDAYDAARSIYTYGMTGRSAAEQSVNMVFFPFSFMKKTVGHFAKYLTEDYSRAVILHDMLKGYEMLDEKYDLDEKFEKYLPIANKMRRLNLFAYGLSLGEFGGPNAPFLRGAWHTIGQPAEAAIAGLAGQIGGEDIQEKMMMSPLLSIMMPQAISIKDSETFDDLQKTIRRMFPVWNDVRHLLGDLMEQGEVLFNGQTKRGQNNDAWDEWEEVRSGVADQLASVGLPYSSINRDHPQIRALKTWRDKRKAEILAKYPSWGAEMAGGAEGAAARQIELSERMNNPTEPVDAVLINFNNWLQSERQAMSDAGYYISDVDFLPPEFHQLVRDNARKLVEFDPEFLRLYNRFYARDYGPIAREIR